jgi:hypothetical protein
MEEWLSYAEASESKLKWRNGGIGFIDFVSAGLMSSAKADFI